MCRPATAARASMPLNIICWPSPGQRQVIDCAFDFPHNPGGSHVNHERRSPRKVFKGPIDICIFVLKSGGGDLKIVLTAQDRRHSPLPRYLGEALESPVAAMSWAAWHDLCGSVGSGASPGQRRRGSRHAGLDAQVLEAGCNTRTVEGWTAVTRNKPIWPLCSYPVGKVPYRKSRSDEQGRVIIACSIAGVAPGPLSFNFRDCHLLRFSFGEGDSSSSNPDRRKLLGCHGRNQGGTSVPLRVRGQTRAAKLEDVTGRRDGHHA